LAVVTDALESSDATGTPLWYAELHRLKGELLLAHDPAAEPNPKIAFGQAIDNARRQRWELRASASLARLLGRQGKRDEARQMLADVYGWFTEGFDTADLRDAKRLLDELSSAAM
jgi:predicted ATPase